MSEIKGFKWFVFEQRGENKSDDKKLSEGFSRDWQAIDEMKKITSNMNEDELAKKKIYIGKEYQT